MSRFVYNPLNGNLVNVNPRNATIPESAYRTGNIVIQNKRPKPTSPVLVAISIVLVIILILTIVYLFWLWFVRDPDESSTSIFDWIANLGSSN